MYFTSLPFAVFFIAAIVGYYTVFRRVQWPYLLVCSFVFYAFSGWSNLLYISATIVTIYIATMRMEAHLIGQQQHFAKYPELDKAAKKQYRAAVKRRRFRWFLGCLLVNLGILAVVKYADFALTGVSGIRGLLGMSELGLLGLALPMGISFYTFQAVGYLIESFRAKKPGEIERNPAKLALFVSFFPQLIQGPISRFGDLHKQLVTPHAFSTTALTMGLQRVFWGLLKKLIVADRLMVAVKTLVASPEDFGGLFTLAAIVLYAVTLYCDFTGGIDITLGVARMLGVKLAENFDRPFYSRNIAEYWRRWHITMGAWFRDYIFYPLSVSRPMLKMQRSLSGKLGDAGASRAAVYLITLVTWLATGLWHGASWNFVVWGLANGLVIILSQECSPLYRRFHARFPALSSHPLHTAWQIMRTFLLMSCIRSFDIYPSVGQTLRNLGSMFTAPAAGRFVSARIWRSLGLSLADFGLAAIFVGVIILAGIFSRRRAAAGRAELSNTARLGLICVMALAVLVFGRYGLGVDMNQFIYNQF